MVNDAGSLSRRPFTVETKFEVDIATWGKQFRAGQYPRPKLTPATFEAEFSMDYELGLQPNSRMHLRNFREPQVGANLHPGPEDTFPRINCDVVCHVLKNPEVSGVHLDTCDVLTGRNCLSMLSTALYSRRSFNLSARKTEEGPVDMWSGSAPRGKRNRRRKGAFLPVGLMFEKAATECVDRSTSNVGQGKYYAFVRRQLGSTRMVFCAEMDCCKRRNTRKESESCAKQMNSFIELKSLHKRTYDTKRTDFYRNKANSIWFQCYIAGVEKIVFGWYDDDHELVEVKHTTTASLRKASGAYLDSEGLPRWNTDKMIIFLDYIVSKVREMCEEHPGRTLNIEFNGDERKITAYVEYDDEIECDQILPIDVQDVDESHSSGAEEVIEMPSDRKRKKRHGRQRNRRRTVLGVLLRALALFAACLSCSRWKK